MQHPSYFKSYSFYILYVSTKAGCLLKHINHILYPIQSCLFIRIYALLYLFLFKHIISAFNCEDHPPDTEFLKGSSQRILHSDTLLSISIYTLCGLVQIIHNTDFFLCFGTTHSMAFCIHKCTWSDVHNAAWSLKTHHQIFCSQMALHRIWKFRLLCNMRDGEFLVQHTKLSHNLTQELQMGHNKCIFWHPS